MQARAVGVQPCLQRGGEDAVASRMQYPIRISQQWHPAALPGWNASILQHMPQRMTVRAARQQDAFATLPGMRAHRRVEARSTGQFERRAGGELQDFAAVPLR